MPSMLAIVSKAVFEQEAKSADGNLLNVGDYYHTDRYRSTNAVLNHLAEGGALFLVTVRPGDILWLIGVLEYPKFKEDAWVAEGPNYLPITDITHLTGQIRFASGKGIQCDPGKLGMALQTPRVLTEEDLKLLRNSFGQAGSTRKDNEQRVVETPQKTTISPEKLKTLYKLFRVSSRVRIDDMAAMLGLNRPDLMIKLLDFADKYHFKIAEDVIVFDTGNDSSDFVKSLEREFESWSRSTEKVQ